MNAFGSVLHALNVFWMQLTAVRFGPLGIAIGFHLAKVLVRTRAWRNIVAASYPELRVPWRTCFGAYVAGVGVNAVVPARGGDALKLLLMKRRLPEVTYPTLAATLIVETLFDLVVATGLFLWALTLGVLPGLHALPSLPSIDWTWVLRHPRVGIAIGIGVLVAVIVGATWAGRRVRAFRARVAQGFTILRDRRRFAREVIAWQALSWVFRIASVVYFLRAFNLRGSIHQALLVQVVNSLSTLFPVTPGGVGTEQGLLVYVLRGHESATAVLSFSVGMRVALTVVNLVLGFAAIALMLRTLDWRRVVRAEETRPT